MGLSANAMAIAAPHAMSATSAPSPSPPSAGVRFQATTAAAVNARARPIKLHRRTRAARYTKLIQLRRHTPNTAGIIQRLCLHFHPRDGVQVQRGAHSALVCLPMILLGSVPPLSSTEDRRP